MSVNVSIIIPCYNVSKYLKDCLKSIQSQAYSSFEVILIDDGSTDGTPELCERFAEVFHDVKVFHIPNGGVSNARNIALSHCLGEYITFLDADDMLTSDYIQNMYEAIIKENGDVVICRERHFSNYNSELLKSEKRSPSVCIISNASDFDYCGPMAHSTVWGCLFRRSLLEGLSFRTDIVIAEDSLFFNYAISRAERIVFLDEVLYNYRIRSDSATGKTPYSSKKMTEITSWKEIVAHNDAHFAGKPIALSAHYCLGSNAIKGIKLMNINGGYQERVLKQLVKIARNEKSVIKQTSISYKKRLWYELFCYFPHICGWAYKYLKRGI